MGDHFYICVAQNTSSEAIAGPSACKTSLSPYYEAQIIRETINRDAGYSDAALT